MDKRFFMAMNPPTVTHQEKKVHVVKGKPQFYEPYELKAARAMFCAKLAEHKPDAPWSGPIKLVVEWGFPLDKGRRHKDGEPKTSRPDTDNLQKLLKDCMTAVGFWKDDAQVCMEQVSKSWAAIPGIYIHVSRLEAEE